MHGGIEQISIVSLMTLLCYEHVARIFLKAQVFNTAGQVDKALPGTNVMGQLVYK